MAFTVDGKRGDGGPRESGPRGPGAPAPAPGPWVPNSPIGTVAGAAAPKPAPNAAAKAPKGPAAPPTLPDPAGNGAPPPVAGPPQAAPQAAFNRPGQNLQAFLGARLGAFDPRQRSRGDVQEAIQRLGGEGGPMSPTSLQAGPSMGAPGMVGGLAPGAGFKQFEDQERLLGVLGALR
jgi:hypothetical protein